MRFDKPVRRAVLLRRYKRFLADVRFDDGEELTVHCANPGAMTGCMEPGSEILVSESDNKKRKLRFSWELVRVGGTWVGINTALANPVVREAIEQGRIPELAGYDDLQAEVPYGEASRVDFLLTKADERCYVEVKNTTLARGAIALFPDSVTERGLKHLRELERVVVSGDRAVMLFLVNREDCTGFEAASDIDPEYSQALESVLASGVEILVYRASVRPEGISVESRIDRVAPTSAPPA